MTRRLWTGPLSIACLVLCAIAAQAQRQRAYRGSYQSVRQTILRLENRANLFRNSVDNGNRSDGTYNANGDFSGTAREFNDSVRRLRNNFDRRQATSSDVQDLLNRATRVDDFMRLNSPDVRAQNYWTSIRADLNQLASAFNLTWQTSAYTPPYTSNPPYTNPNSGYPTYGNQYGVQALTGTYRLDPSRSEDARLAADRAARGLSANERTRVLDQVSRRLDPPDELAIEVRGRQVTLASTRAPQVVFDADGQDRIETSPSGRTIHARAFLSGNQLTVNSTGDSGNQFNVVFQTLDNGRALNVTRRIYLPELNQSVQVRSTYQKTSDVARFDIYNQQNATQYPVTASAGGFIVPDGARIVGVVDNPLSTRTAAVGDRFTLRVTEPAEFRDATIEGHVSSVQRSGRLSGRSGMTLDFDTIRLSDGRQYQFAGLLENVNTRNGESVRVDTEGTVRDQNQTTRTGERAAIGTAVGAIIGAIAGGGKGAAIGAVVGAGAGAGSIYVEGRNDLDLERGSELVIRAGAPFNTPR
ncbi:MAG: YMGG-like glycine zipper-containing protein [Pyrinomonadaceae bacterium]